MNVFLQRLYSFSYRFIQLCSLILIFILFAGAFVCTCYSDNMETQLVLTRWDNPLSNLAGAAVFLLVLGGICHILFRRSASSLKLLRIFTLFWCAGLGGILIIFGRTVPSGDPYSIYSIAEAMAAGNTSVIDPTTSYLSYNPHQIGLTAFYEILIRIWNLLPFDVASYHFIKCINVVLLCVIVYFQEQTVHLLWKNEKTDCIYLLLIGANLPFIMYSSFFYGEIPSFAAASVGFYYLLKLLSTGDSISYIVFAVLGLSLSVMLRKNNLILLIAALIVIVAEWVKTRRHNLLIVGVIGTICSLSILPLVVKNYELRAGSRLSSGSPAISYIAMGMQESTRGNGWYNGFNFVTYQESGLNTELATERSKQAISERLQYFKDHPGYAVDFYLYKHLSQWADGTYASRQATLATYGGRSSFFQSLYEGSLSSTFISYCNTYQNILYLGALICFILLWREWHKKRSVPTLHLYLCSIAVIGGFLFHVLWEANSRYIFLYSLLLLPYTAKGLSSLIIHFSAKDSEKVTEPA